jgi:nitroreductase
MESWKMTVMDVIRSRVSVRKWKNQPVEKKQLEVLMEAAQRAPSAYNWQPYRFILVDDPSKLGMVSEAAGQPRIAKAPLFIAGVADPKKSARWHLVDTVIALTHIMLAAYELGLAGVWIGAFDEDGIKKSLGIPKDLVVAGTLALGVPDEKPSIRSRKKIEELFSRNQYDKPFKP